MPKSGDPDTVTAVGGHGGDDGRGGGAPAVAVGRIDAGTLRLWTRVALDALGEARAAIDSLNVFPVPDGDTGTNMFLTLEAGCAGIEEAFAQGGDAVASSGAADVRRPALAVAAQRLSAGALLGARGNSGVILSQILRGIADVLASVPDGAPFDADVVRRSLRRAADGAYAAVAAPVEGTILTVARAAAEAAEAVTGDDRDDVVAVVEQAAAAAHAALARTTEQLPALRAAGVVDSGGQGLVVVYDSLVDIVTGIRRRRPRIQPRRTAATDPVRGAETGGPPYEVMYLFDGDAAAVEALRTRLAPMGDSLVVSGESPLWNVHVHVHDAGAAIEAALDLGRPHRVAVTYLATRPVPEAPVAGTRGLVAVAHGPGVAAVLAEAGAVVVPAQPQRRPSTAEILAAITASGASEVLLLPSDSDTLPVAEAAAQEARSRGVRAAVIPTRSVTQTLAAVAVHDALGHFDDDVVAMTRAAGATHYGAVTIAVREALTTAGTCSVGDVLGLADGDIIEIGADVVEVAWRIVERLLTPAGELVTLVVGEAAPTDLASSLGARLQERHPGVDLVVIDGGQPLWPAILGVE